MLAKALLAYGERVIPIVWSTTLNAPVVASKEDTQALRRWNGPDFGEIAEGGRPVAAFNFSPGTWLLVPEVTHLTRHQQDLTKQLLQYARRHGLKAAFLFYDALLVKWAIREYEPFRRAHELYMLELANADLVLPISKHAGREIAAWWSVRVEGAVKADVVSCPLPAEFPGVARVTR